jgi:hypothetical protein
MTDDTYRDDDEKEEKRRRKMRRRMTRRRVWHSRPHYQRAKPSKTLQVKMMTQALMTWMMRRCLFVKRFGKFMVKKDYRARRKKSSSKNKKVSRKCFKCGTKDHLVAQCPYNSDNDDDDKKNKKKDKKVKKEKKDKMTIVDGS